MHGSRVFQRSLRLPLRLLALAVGACYPGLAQTPSTPFLPRSQPSGATTFTTLPSSYTGLSAPNPYDDPRMWGELYREFSLGAIGTGVAVGDYDNDGKPDLYVACKTGANHLFHNEGGFRFTDVTAQAGVAGPVDAWKQGVAWADVNGDGLLDLYVCRFNAPNLLYINQGNGTFKEEAEDRGVAVTDASGQAAFCDYDRDGHLDFFLQTNLLDGEARPNGQRDYLFHNNGDGTFTEVAEKAGISGDTQGHSATWWDFNEDGWPDLYVANDFKDPDQLYQNNGDGTFTNVITAVVPHMPHSAMGADFGDINNDGHVDLLVADMAATSRYKDQRGMAKLRAALPDMDEHASASPQYMRNALYLNTGLRRMMEVAHLAGLQATDWTWSVRFEDLDNDGLLDVFFTNGMVRELHSSDLVKLMLGSENGLERARLCKASPVLAETHLAFKNLGDLAFQNVSPEWGLDKVGVGFGAAFADFDNDGDLDLVFASLDGDLTVCRNDSTTGNSLILDLREADGNRFALGTKATLEGPRGLETRVLVSARGYLSTSEPALHFGLGNLEEVKNVRLQWPDGSASDTGPLKAGRRYVIEKPAGLQPSVPVRPQPLFHAMEGSQRFEHAAREDSSPQKAQRLLLSKKVNRAGPSLTVADVDGDGEKDLVVGGTGGDTAKVFFHLGGGRLLPECAIDAPLAGGPSDGALLAFDANQDGKPDLLQLKGGDLDLPGAQDFQPQLFLGQGHGRYLKAQEGTLPSLAISVGAAAVADFDRDGKLEVFLGARQEPGSYPGNPDSVLLRNEGGSFVRESGDRLGGLEHAGLVTAALWVDVDRDGWVDLVVATEWGTLRAWRNLEGKGFEEVSQKWGFSNLGSGWWNSLATADFNGDGIPDFIAGNLGLNTPFKAAPGAPFTLFRGAFDASGKQAYLETYYEAGSRYPVRGLPELASIYPSLYRKFPTFDSFAKADLPRIFSQAKLDAAEQRSADQFSSVALLSNPDGTYRVQPLPRLAQAFPIYGLAVADFNGDGALDFACAGNSFDQVGDIGRFDGGLGLLVLGDGRGGFQVSAPDEAGLMLPGNVRALVAADLRNPGTPDLYATRGGAVSSALALQLPPGSNTFSVALRGPTGNTEGLGATVTVLYRDGRQQSQVVLAGEGHRTQGTATPFFGYKAENPPLKIVVTWPDGTRQESAWIPDSHRLVLSHP